MEKNYSDILCQAIEIVTSSIVGSISYDKTIECTVVDDSNRKNGEYIVSNSASKFEAYSNITAYRSGDVVYVSIPDNNYDNQKFISGKKVSDSQIPFNFTTPFDTILDLTNNMVLGSTFAGLVANGEVETYEVFNLTGLNYCGFTRFGIQAAFKSWLKELKVVNGTYGLKLTITDKTEDVKTGWVEGTHYLLLDSSDMYGNPYDFESFFQQEKVFDISSLGTITGIRCEFYQVKNSFTDSSGAAVSLIDDYGNEAMPNLFVKDIFICAGYDLRDIKDEYVSLYTFDTKTYIATQTVAQNTKDVHLRWVHLDDNDNPVAITAESNLDYEIRWYRYRLGAPTADKYSSVYWDLMATDLKSFKETIVPDTTKAKEMFKVVIIYNNVPYRSNVLTFENEKEVINQPTVDAMQALSIECNDGTYGNYLIYDEGNSLIDSSQGNVDRLLTAYFQSEDYTGGERVILAEATSITWTFPTENTMFVIDDLPNDYDQPTYSITKYGDPDNGYTIDATQNYKIRSYYSAQYLNNTVEVSIVKDGITYNSYKEFNFGQSGTSGTDCTLALTFNSGNNAVKMGTNFDPPIVTARLYDYENNEIDFLATPGVTIEWDWLIKSPVGEPSSYITAINLYDLEKGNIYNKVSLTASDGLRMNQLYILKATVKGWGDYDLVAYLPIPIRKDDSYSYITGANKVIYLSNGEPQYYKKEYKMNFNPDRTENGTWSIFSLNPDRYNATIVNKCLKPVSMYVKNASIYGVQYTEDGDVKWTQPILVLQNRFPSSTLNKWDGKSLTIDDDTGTILSNMIAAGKKDSSTNTFSGVIMGDWADHGDESLSKTGLYGFNAGAMSFSFTEDGKAFIGKDGKGRLLFDGDKATIESQSYASDNAGMILDFDDGFIKMYNRSGNILIDSSNPTLPLKVGANFSVKWDGSITANNGYFGGTLYATAGYIDNIECGRLYGGCITGGTIDGGSIQGGTITGGTISGALVYADKLFIGEGSGNLYALYTRSSPSAPWSYVKDVVYATPPADTDYSKYVFKGATNANYSAMVGEFGGNDGVSTTTVVGIYSKDYATNYSIVLETSEQARISARGFYMDVPPSGQHGIYARFA